MKRPSFQFYPGDWLNDASLRMVSIGARGLWMDMICIMHQGSEYGHLKVNSKVITEVQLARMVGGEISEVRNFLSELEEAGTFSRDEDGAIYSRRMIKDEQLREIRAAGGKEGGNPKLMGGYNKPGFVYAMLRDSDGAVKIGISQDPAKRLYKIKAQYPDCDIRVLAKLYVQDMGAVEAALHSMYAEKKSGEWFSLNKGEVDSLLNVHLKGNSKENQTPSSSSSSSPSSSKAKSKAKTKGADAPQVSPGPLPDWLPVDAWDAYSEMRQKIRKPMTPTAQKLVIAKLEQFMHAGHRPRTVLEQSIVNSWQDVYEPKGSKARDAPQSREAFNERENARAKALLFGSEEEHAAV